MIKVLHTGDLHLGSAFAGYSPEESERRRRIQLDAFHTMLGEATARGVSLILIAGDLFDEETPERDLVDEVYGALAAVALPVVIAPGNHDPYTPRSPYAEDTLPPNVEVFRSSALSRIRIGTCAVDVFGYAFTGSVLSESPLASLPDNACLGEGLSILLAHGDLDLPTSRYGAILSRDLERSGADYVALGHVHNVDAGLLSFGDVRAAYCGFLVGRSFDECGVGGFRLLTFDENATDTHPLVSEERIAVSGLVYRSETLSVTGAESDGDVIAAIRDLLSAESIGKETTLRLSLTGEVALRYEPDLAAIAAAIATGDSPTLTLSDATLPIYDAGYLESDPTLLGAFYRALLPSLLAEKPEERADAAMALRIGLAALHGRAF